MHNLTKHLYKSGFLIVINATLTIYVVLVINANLYVIDFLTYRQHYCTNWYWISYTITFGHPIVADLNCGGWQYNKRNFTLT